jgi:hypothetical protein
MSELSEALGQELEEQQNQWIALEDALREEIGNLRTLLGDEDSSAIARPLRRERVASLEWVQDLMVSVENWQW